MRSFQQESAPAFLRGRGLGNYRSSSDTILATGDATYYCNLLYTHNFSANLRTVGTSDGTPRHAPHIEP
jgi:hypothetical protein